MPHIFHLVDRAARVAADQPAVAVGGTSVLTFAELAGQSCALAGHLRYGLGLDKGDRVALIMANTPEYITVLCACWRAGLVPVPINAKLHEREFAFMLAHSGARMIFTTETLATTVAAAASGGSDVAEIIEAGSPAYAKATSAPPFVGSPPSSDDLAWLFYTSGTTGRPKGAMLSHGNLMAMATSYFIDIDLIAPGDCILHPAPLSHGAGLYVIPHLMAMATQVIPESAGFQPDEILELVACWPGASMFAAPTMVNRLVRHGATGTADLGNLKTIVYGGAPMHVADVEEALDVLGPKLAQLYGQGESPMCITGLSKRWYADRNHPRWRDIIASAGFAQSVVEVAVVNSGNNPVPIGEAGEICARGGPVMSGYWDDPKATADTLRGGWLHTGDVGTLDADGFLTLMDRSKDLIISGGSNIYPREVEEVLLRHPDVAEVSVVGAPHSDWGEEVVAFVVTRNAAPVPQGELDALCRDHIARFKRPKRYIARDDLPKSAYGKILKRELRELLVSDK